MKEKSEFRYITTFFFALTAFQAINNAVTEKRTLTGTHTVTVKLTWNAHGGRLSGGQ